MKKLMKKGMALTSAALMLTGSMPVTAVNVLASESNESQIAVQSEQDVLIQAGKDVPVQAEESSSDEADSQKVSGTWGTCEWTLDDGILTIGGGIGKTSEDIYGKDTPWYKYRFKVTKIVISDKITFEPDTKLVALFRNFGELESIEGLANLDTSNVIDMSYMFNMNITGKNSDPEENYKLKMLDLSGLDTSNVTNMSYMFSNFQKLESIDLSSLDTSKVTNMSGMFSDCHALSNLDMSMFNTSKVTDMSGMFSDCNQLKSIDVSSFDTSNVTNMSYMFYMTSPLRGILNTLDVSNFNTSKVTDMSGMFGGSNKLTSLDVSNFDTSKVTNMSEMFSGCSELTSLDVSGFNTCNVTNMSGMFSGYAASSLDLSGFDTSNVTNMSGMFSGYAASSLDLSGFDTKNVTDMTWMFSGCSELTTLDLSSFDTNKVTNMSYMFYRCYKLESLNLSGFNTSKVQDISHMFQSCTKLLELDISSFDLSNIGSYWAWFSSYFTQMKMPNKMPIDNEAFLKDLKEDMRSGRWKDETSGITYDDRDSVVIEEGHTYVYCPEELKASLTVDNSDEADKKVALGVAAEGGVSLYTYKFIMYNPVNNSWTLLQDYSSIKTYNWDMVGKGKRIFYVDVKDTLGNVKRSEAVTVESQGEELEPITVTADKEENENDVTFTVSATGGTSSYTYKFIVYNKTSRTWGIVQNYSDKDTCTWTKGSDGDRDFYVDVKDSDGNVVRSRAMNVKIDSTKTTAVLKPSSTAVSAGDKLTLTASTNKSGCTYKFLIYNPATEQWFKLQDFGSKNTYTWTAGNDGTRQFYVDVKDADGNVTRSRVVNVTIGEPLSVKAAVSAGTTRPGSKITFTAEGAGGKAGYTYKMVVYNKTTKTWGLVQNFSANNKITWTAGSEGDREFYIDVKDAAGNVVRSSVMNVKTSNELDFSNAEKIYIYKLGLFAKDFIELFKEFGVKRCVKGEQIDLKAYDSFNNLSDLNKWALSTYWNGTYESASDYVVTNRIGDGYFKLEVSNRSIYLLYIPD